MKPVISRPGKNGVRRTSRARKPRKPRRRGSISEILTSFAENATGERVVVGDLIETMEQRGHGMAMLVLSLPMLLPVTPPGVSAVVGLPSALIALQLILRRPHVWLPGFIRRRSMPVEQFRKVVEKTAPYIARIEKLLKPRLTFLTEALGEFLIGVGVLMMALLLVLPVPFTNIPLGLSIALLSMGLIQRDGIVVLAGTVIGTVTAILMVTLGWSALIGIFGLIGLA